MLQSSFVCCCEWTLILNLHYIDGSPSPPFPWVTPSRGWSSTVVTKHCSGFFQGVDNHYPKQWWLVYRRIYTSLSLSELSIQIIVYHKLIQRLLLQSTQLSYQTYGGKTQALVIKTPSILVSYHQCQVDTRSTRSGRQRDFDSLLTPWKNPL